MINSNPVLNQYKDKHSELGNNYLHREDLASLEGVINKTIGGLGMVVLFSIVAFMIVPVGLISPVVIAAALTTVVLSVFVAKREEIKFHHVAIYAVVEGFFVGSMSKFFEMMFPGIIVQAVLGTLVVAALVLAFYKVTGFRASSKFRKFVYIATAALAGLYLINLGLAIFGVNTGIVEVGPSAGWLSIGISVLAIFLATANLLVDFDLIEHHVVGQQPVAEEWRASFGLMVTLVWLYIEMLRILSYLRR